MLPSKMIQFSTTIITMLHHITIMNIVKYRFNIQSKIYDLENDYICLLSNIICKYIFLMFQNSMLFLKRLNTSFKLIFSR